MNYHYQVTPKTQPAGGAKLLSEARIGHARIAEIPAGVRPESVAEAYGCQDAVVQHWLDHYGGEIAGYKIACTNVTAQRQLNVDGPFHGKLLSAFCFESPATLPTDRFFMRVIEAEFGFLMGRDLPPAAEPRSREEVAAAVDALVPGIEIVDSRFDDWTTIGAPSLTADNACNAAWVRGTPVKNWQHLDLAEHTVRLTVNGKLHREGSGRAVLGHPLNALKWLADTLSSQGRTLKAGQFVTTGVTMEVYFAERGDHCVADFGPLGMVEVEFT